MKPERVIDPARVARILDAPGGSADVAPWAGPLAELCYATGLPLERLLAARVRDVDLDGRLLGLGADRAVPIGRPAAAALRPLITGRPVAGPVFSDPAGRRIRADAARAALDRRARAAGVALDDAAAVLAASMHAHLVARGADPEVAAGLVDPGSGRRSSAAPEAGPASGAIGRAHRRLAVRRTGRR